MELVITTDVGPRILRFGFLGGDNLFKEYPEHLGHTGGGEWRAYGGHRLWHAPEANPRTYWPDNHPVDYSWDGKTLSLVSHAETTTGIQKEIEITLDPDLARVTVLHRLVNRNLWDIPAAPWCLSVMAAGGRAVIPQEPYRPHPEYLLPARPVVLWHYTDMSDPRWTWGKKFIQLQQRPGAATKQKIGMRNSLGWMAYSLGDVVFVKTYPHDPAAEYPDFGCNSEIFTDANMLELETLGPLAMIPAGGKAELIERWQLHRLALGRDEQSIEKDLVPLITAAQE